MSRILLVTPVFHGYGDAIASAFNARGHDVVTHCYDEFKGVRAKVRNKVRYELAEKAGRAGLEHMSNDVTRAAINRLRGCQPDVVVVIKGDLLGDDFWAELGSRPRVLWLYDELRRTGWQDREPGQFAPVCTYSRQDAATLSRDGALVRHLPLAFDHRLAQPDPRIRNDEVVFVGARYPRREELLVDLVRAGVRVRAHGRDWSTHPFDRLRTYSLRRPKVPSDRDLDRAAAYAEMAAGLATLNIHGDQDGFTMRTFEACGVGGVQLIDRVDLDGLYDDGVELAAFSSTDELVELCHRARRDRRWADRLRTAGRERTLAEHTFDNRVRALEELWG